MYISEKEYLDSVTEPIFRALEPICRDISERFERLDKYKKEGNNRGVVREAYGIIRLYEGTLNLGDVHSSFHEAADAIKSSKFRLLLPAYYETLKLEEEINKTISKYQRIDQGNKV